MRKILVIAFVLASMGHSYAQSDCKCCSEKFRQFDFWMGNWEAFTPDGKLAGTNTIDLVQDSCVLRESWISTTPGYTGTSFNFYNASSDTWHQTWVDNQGGSLLLKGKFDGKSMVLSSDSIAGADGKITTHRITWSPNSNGTVRQLWESQSDGADWTVLFDGEYRRK